MGRRFSDPPFPCNILIWKILVPVLHMRPRILLPPPTEQLRYSILGAEGDAPLDFWRYSLILNL